MSVHPVAQRTTAQLGYLLERLRESPKSIRCGQLKQVTGLL